MINYENNSLSFRFKYEYEDSCRVTSRTVSGKWLQNLEWINLRKNKYEMDFENRIEYFEDYNWGDDKWQSIGGGYNLFNDDFQIIEFYYDNNHPGSLKRNNFYIYAKDGSFVTSKHNQSDFDGGWHQIFSDSLAKKYDEKGRLSIEYLWSRFYHDLPKISNQRYQYYCDDLLKEKSVETFTALGYTHHKTIYEYDAGTDCGESETLPHMTLFPNPASVKVTVQSS